MSLWGSERIVPLMPPPPDPRYDGHKYLGGCVNRSEHETLLQGYETLKQRLDVEMKRTEILTKQLIEVSAWAVKPPIWIVPAGTEIPIAHLTPTKGETKLNVRENAGAMLGQVQSHLANVEGQLKTANARLKEIERVRVDHRALYVNLDGSTRNAPVMAGPEGPMREVRFEELQPGSIRYIEDPSRYGAYIKPTRRIYRLAFTQGSTLHVYQEV